MNQRDSKHLKPAAPAETVPAEPPAKKAVKAKTAAPKKAAKKSK